MPANRLSLEKSPYLAQHADNPVDWYAWDDEAFAKARKEQKPILLSIGYSTCHWCHVMAHESFEDEGIADFLNTHFVSIKVDREERPDIDHIYMGAVTAMTGQGGWPLTVFLTPNAEPFYGGTYFPPYAKWGAPGFMDLLKSVSDAWRTNKEQIVNSAVEITALLRSNAAASKGEGDLQPDILDTAARQMLGAFDAAHGGFGGAPKFPMGHNLSFLLRYYKRSKDQAALDAVEKTLQAMARGGIYDHLGGGFHRYATDQKWHVPHFEKMLYDQALLVLAYTEAYQATGELPYARTVRETLDYVLRDMTLPQGGFYCAEDADSEGKEGAFYVWSQEEIVEVLGAHDAEVFDRYYGVKPGGNVGSDPHGEFIGKNILFLAESPSPEDEAVLTNAKAKLFAYRSKRLRPHLDDKVLTDWNGLMIAAFAFAGCALGEARYIDAARKAAEFINSRLKSKEGRLLHRWRGNEASIDGMLEDHAFLCFGLVHLYEATLEQRYLNEALGAAEAMTALFTDDKNGGFFMTTADSSLLLRPQDIYDGALPSGNSVAAYVLIKLHYLTGRDDLKLKAEGVFKCFMGLVGKAPQAYAFFLSALDFCLFPPVEISVHGELEQSAIVFLRKVVYKHFIPAKVVKAVPAAGPWSVSVCRNGSCLPKVSDMAALETMIN